MKRKVKAGTLKPGDVIAIPRKAGGYYLVLHLAANRFGEAFGLFQGFVDSPDFISGWTPVSLGVHAYTGSHLVKTGRWKKIEHRDDLRTLFSPAPEIFHCKAFNPSDPSIGPYGSGETADGRLRQLSEAEATSIGLTQGTYRQIMLEEQFEEYLQKLLG